MIWWIPAAMAAAGYLIDKKQGGSGFKGAAMGGALGMGFGAGGAAGTGLTSGATSTGATMTGFGGAGAISPYASSGLLGNTGLGMGGWGSGSLGGMQGTGFSPAASNAALGGGGSSIFGSFNPSTFTASEGSLGNMMGGGGQAQMQNTGGFLEIPSINEGLLNTNTMSANTLTGPQQAAANDVGLLDNLGLGFIEPYMPTKRDIGSQVIGMGVNALTPEQEERLRHQQAMLMRGQTGNVLGQGGTSGIGGQYISRA